MYQASRDVHYCVDMKITICFGLDWGIIQPEKNPGFILCKLLRAYRQL